MSRTAELCSGARPLVRMRSGRDGSTTTDAGIFFAFIAVCKRSAARCESASHGFVRHHLQDHVQAALKIEAKVNVLSDAGHDAPCHTALRSRLAHSVNAGFGVSARKIPQRNTSKIPMIASVFAFRFLFIQFCHPERAFCAKIPINLQDSCSYLSYFS